MATTTPLAYNIGAPIDGTTQVGSLAVGTTSQEYSLSPGGVPWWMGPDEELGYVIAVPVSGNTQSTPISGVTASVGFYRSENLTDNSFITVSEYVANEYGTPQTFSSASDASTWLTNNGYWNSWVGQSLYLDSGNPSSYPGSGTVWYDITTNNNNSTLQNGVTYSPSYSGILQFNSSNAQYGSFSSPINVPTGNSQYTINAWFNPSSNGTLGIIGWGTWGSTNQVNALRLGNNLFINYWWGNDLVVPYSYNIGQWYNICVTFDGTYRTMYANGVQIGQDTPGTPNVGSASNMQVGTTNGSEYFNGSIPIVEVYPRALTSGEILSKYNTTYPRFVDTTPTPTPTGTLSVTPTPTPTGTLSVTPTPTPTPTSGVSGNFNVSISQVGPNVVWNGSGSFNLNSLSLVGSQNIGAGLQSTQAIWAIGPVTSVQQYGGASFTNYPTSFGVASSYPSPLSSGSTFGIIPGGVSGRVVLVPSGYTSNTVISGTSTYASTTIAGMGLTPGTYTWSWGSGGDTSTLIMTITP